MAIFQPSFVTPDVRSGLGLGVIDATQDMTVSWRINGPSALTAFSVTLYNNDSESTQLYTTGRLTDGCPAYGTTSAGAAQFFSYTIDAADLSNAGIVNGNEYKIIITQWCSASDSVTQSSASVFVTRAAPILSISTIGTGGEIDTRYYTFTGSYSQAQGDTLNWFRWRIAAAGETDTPFFDTGNISGTMDISCTYDGFFTGTDYAVRLNIQTENGVEADTGWVSFSVDYPVTATTGEVTAGCVGGTDAVLVKWDGIGYIPGTASGGYSITGTTAKYLNLPGGETVTWDRSGVSPMSFSPTWSVVWRGILGTESATLFTIGQADGDITLRYAYDAHTLTLSKGATALFTQTGIINTPTVTVILTPDTAYLRCRYQGGGLVPNTSLYPDASLYPAADNVTIIDKNSYAVSYAQGAVTSVQVGGYQRCRFMELINGTASQTTIDQAYNNGTYTPGANDEDYLRADWQNGLDAGTLDINGEELTGFALYRRQGENANLVRVAETDNATGAVYDYGAVSQGGPYTYFLFPVGASTYIASALTSGTVMPCWWNWTLMECEETTNENVFTVLAAYRFRYNIETGAMSNNNAPSLLANFTPYPKVQLAPQNYKSGSLGGLIGVIDWSSGQPEYTDTTDLRDAIMALSVTQHPLFLKNRKGDLFRVKLSGAVSMQTDDKTREQTQTMTLPWVEVGTAENVSLYSTEFAGVQEEEGAYTPQYYVDTSDATATAAELRIYRTGYGSGGKLTGEAEVTVDGKTLVLPAGMEV